MRGQQRTTKTTLRSEWTSRLKKYLTGPTLLEMSGNQTSSVLFLPLSGYGCQALNQWPPNQKGLGDRAWQCNDGVRAVGDSFVQGRSAISHQKPRTWLWRIPKRTARYPDIARSIRGAIFAPGHSVFHGARRGQG